LIVNKKIKEQEMATRTIVKKKKIMAKSKTVKTTVKAKAKVTKADRVAPSDKIFWMSNGDTVSKLGDLPKKLKTLDAGTFTHHVNSEKNDFASWIEGVFEDRALAVKVSKAKTKTQIISALRTALNKK
jgi:hypothetical protein